MLESWKFEMRFATSTGLVRQQIGSELNRLQNALIIMILLLTLVLEHDMLDE